MAVVSGYSSQAAAVTLVARVGRAGTAHRWPQRCQWQGWSGKRRAPAATICAAGSGERGLPEAGSGQSQGGHVPCYDTALMCRLHKMWLVVASLQWQKSSVPLVLLCQKKKGVLLLPGQFLAELNCTRSSM